jgi:hypothetical protein
MAVLQGADSGAGSTFEAPNASGTASIRAARRGLRSFSARPRRLPAALLRFTICRVHLHQQEGDGKGLWGPRTNPSWSA